MMLFPEAQKQAQAEVDRVIGNDRLPGIADRESLPYVAAVLKEVLRWRPVVPMGEPCPMSPRSRAATHLYTSVALGDARRRVPRLPHPGQHCTRREHLVRSCMFHTQTEWELIERFRAALHDETVYKNPDVFRPERFLPPENAPDSSSFAFGFGRRYVRPAAPRAPACVLTPCACTAPAPARPSRTPRCSAPSRASSRPLTSRRRATRTGRRSSPCWCGPRASRGTRCPPPALSAQSVADAEAQPPAAVQVPDRAALTGGGEAYRRGP